MSKEQKNPVGRPVLGDEAKTSFIQIRVEPSKKARYVKKAQKSAHRKLAPWIIETLDEACE